MDSTLSDQEQHFKMGANASGASWKGGTVSHSSLLPFFVFSPLFSAPSLGDLSRAGGSLQELEGRVLGLPAALEGLRGSGRVPVASPALIRPPIGEGGQRRGSGT